jgi:hypothetical protein
MTLDSTRATCYMCEEVETSREHVPPKCLFPELKDLPEGKDLRKNLVSVPSCDEHNSQKSKDDEYLLYVLVSCHLTNQAGQKLAESKLSRAIRRNPSLMKRLLEHSAPAVIKDAQGTFETIRVEFDGPRFQSIGEKIGRALYFHHFRQKWVERIKFVCNFTFLVSGPNAQAVNQDLSVINGYADKLFAAAPNHGENPEVFTYNALTDERSGQVVIRANFYGEARMTILFLQNAEPFPHSAE